MPGVHWVDFHLPSMYIMLAKNLLYFSLDIEIFGAKSVLRSYLILNIKERHKSWRRESWKIKL